MMLLASKLKTYTIPRNDFLLRTHDVTAGIIIIRDGILTIKPDIKGSLKAELLEDNEERGDSLFTTTMPDENSNENLKKLARKSKGAAGQSNINFSMQDVTKNRKKQMEIFVRSDQLKPGDCV